MNFNATAKADTAGQISGGVKCVVSASGLTITKGKKPPMVVPIGAATRADGRTLYIQTADRQISVTVQKFGAYQSRIASDLSAFLSGGRPPLVESDYKLELYMFAISLLPFGIMILTRGGALWGAIGGALGMVCLGIAQNEQMPKAVRLAIILMINLFIYGGVALLMANVPKTR